MTAWGLVGSAESAAQPALAAEPAQLARDLVADEQALRDPSSSDAVLQAAALRQQAAYRAIGRHPEWEPIVRPVIPASLAGIYGLNVDARHHLMALNGGDVKDTLPAWRIDPPAPTDELLGYYRAAARPFRIPREYRRWQAAVTAAPTTPLLYLHGRDDGCLGIDLAAGTAETLPPAAPCTSSTVPDTSCTSSSPGG